MFVTLTNLADGLPYYLNTRYLRMCRPCHDVSVLDQLGGKIAIEKEGTEVFMDNRSPIMVKEKFEDVVTMIAGVQDDRS